MKKLTGLIITGLLIGALNSPVYAGMTYIGTDGVLVMPDHTVALSYTPVFTTLAQGQTINVTFTETSGPMLVNALTFYASYPADQLEVLSINTSASPFSLQVENSGANGVIKLSRGTIKPVSGLQPVAVVQFRAKRTTTTSVISIDTSKSALVTSDTNQNLLANSTIQNNKQPLPTATPAPIFSIWSQILSLFANLRK